MKYTKIVNKDIENIITDFGPKELEEKLKNKTLLITGASGMIGSYICYLVLYMNQVFNTNTKLIAVVRNLDKLDKYIRENENTKVVIQDVVEAFNINEPIDYIIHAASPASPKIMSTKPVETNLANTLGTANTLKLAHEKKVLSYLFVSSREIYGEPNKGQTLFYEDGELGQVDPLVPRNGYAEGKKAAENLCVGYNDEYNLNTKIVRLAHTYGPGMSIYDGRVQADFLKNIMNDEDIVLKSDGSSIRTYTYISDAIEAILLILLKSKDIVYNISDEKSETSIKELAETLINLVSEKKLKLIFDIPKESQKGCAAFKMGILSSEKIRNELGWKPRYSISEGFSRTINHLKDELEKIQNSKDIAIKSLK